MNKAFQSTIAWFKTALETRWLVMGTNHAKKRMQSWHRKALWTFTKMWRNVLIGEKAKSEFVDTFILKGDMGIIRLCTRSFITVDSLGHTRNLHIGSFWNMLMIAPPGKQVLAYCSQFVHRFINSRLITTVPASVHTTWHPLLIWAKRANLRDFIFFAAAALCDSVTSCNSDAPAWWSPTCSLSFQRALNQLCAFFRCHLQASYKNTILSM